MRTADELATMRRAGRVVAEMHAAVEAAIRPGVTLIELDRIAGEVIERRGAASNFLGYHGYPAVICASVNEVIVHGIPDGTALSEGDIVSIDCGAIVDGYHGDAAWTYPVGEIEDRARRLVDAATDALDAGIAQMHAGRRLSDIGHAVQTVAEGAGFSVVRDYTGHGIGTEMHEAPSIPNFGPPGRGPTLVAGNILAVEPMLCVGSAESTVDGDGWTVRAADGSLAAHVEHTVAVTDDGPEILTAR
ncbi:MAG TPA: type I methionyl aminopeptidase [Acidimicrobiales bacterium]